MKIIADKLGKRFNREWIFRNITYQFEPAKTYAITGPNGSGKSTLLQLLWGQVPPSDGTLNYFDENEQSIAVEEVFRHTAIATPYMDLIEEFTLQEMVEFHFKFKKPRAGMSLESVVDLIGLPKAKDKLIGDFSSGMRQRLKLALAFLSTGSILFLDEPTTNLDHKSTSWYLQRLAEVPANTMIFIASNQEHEYPATAIKLDIMSYK